MKKVIMTVAMVIWMMAATQAQEAKSSVTVTREGKTFTAVKTQGTRTSGSSYTATGFTYIDTDGEAYEIHTHTTAKGEHAGETKCYIQKTSKKSGKNYWKAIPVKHEELK